MGRYRTVGQVIDPYTRKCYPLQKLVSGKFNEFPEFDIPHNQCQSPPRGWGSKTYLRVPTLNGYAIVFWKPLDGQRIEIYFRNEKEGTFRMREMIACFPKPLLGSDEYNIWTGYSSWNKCSCPNLRL